MRWLLYTADQAASARSRPRKNARRALRCVSGKVSHQPLNAPSSSASIQTGTSEASTFFVESPLLRDRGSCQGVPVQALPRASGQSVSYSGGPRQGDGWWTAMKRRDQRVLVILAAILFVGFCLAMAFRTLIH